MDKRYLTLVTLANIVRETLYPTQYFCTPREMILHSTLDWDTIHTHLNMLQLEGMILVRQADTLQFSITQKGMDKVMSVEEPHDSLEPPSASKAITK